VLELFLDLFQVFRIRLEVERMRPLEPRFQLAPDLPIGIAEVIFDR
jgi:hypothetical protein